jgi:formamidopyrimidine-DNA glycosylase
MPELPEVETIRAGLHRALRGRVIREVHITETRLRRTVDPQRLKDLTVGQGIASVDRRAKYLLCRLSNQATLVLHLGMSGRILLCDEALPLERHDHIQFRLDDGREVRFRDPRRFGLVDAFENGELQKHPLFANLGIEPFDPACTPEFLFERSRQLTKPIKNFLMDGSIIVGVGNIYANEALFRAKINPKIAAGKLKRPEWRKLLKSVHKTLELAIAAGGTTLNDFHDSDGAMGYFQQQLMVYSRDGEGCYVCGRKIKRLVQAGRSTFYCPHCQAKRRS